MRIDEITTLSRRRWTGMALGAALIVAIVAWPMAPSRAQASTPNLVANGGFELGTTSWKFNGPNLFSAATHTGTHSAQICGYAGCDDTLTQTVVLPSPATSLTLVYWLLRQRGASTPGACTSSVTATLSTGGTTRTTAGRGCASLTPDIWTWVSVDATSALRAYAGKNVTLGVLGTSPSGDDTSYILDDVSVEAGTPVTPTPTATAPTTATASATPPSARPYATPSPPPTASPTATPAPSPSATSTPSASPGGRWVPPAGNVPWQWEIDHPLSVTSSSDLGTGVTTASGAPAPNPVVYDIDGFDNPAATVAALHSRGFHAICYIEVGAAENYRADYSRFPAAALGSTMPGYSSERYIDIRNATVVGVIESRIAMCAQKGFDAIEPDIDDSYTASTGFPLTMSDNVRFSGTLAAYAHSLGVSYGLKNGDDPSYAAQMLPIADFVMDEQCFEYSTCDAFFPGFRNAGKAVFEVEYSLSTSSFCTSANADGFNAMRQNVALKGGRSPCR